MVLLPPPKGHVGVSGGIFGLSQWGGGLLLVASGEQKPGKLLNSLQCRTPQERAARPQVMWAPRACSLPSGGSHSPAPWE